MISPGEFKKRLKAAGWTQRAVSKKLGHVPSWLSRKISGAREMNCDELLKICEVTGITPQELLGFNAPEPKPEGADERISRELAALLPDNIIQGILRVREERKK
jgi:transcriptional regulator with XRE-family HTH domain